MAAAFSAAVVRAQDTDTTQAQRLKNAPGLEALRQLPAAIFSLMGNATLSLLNTLSDRYAIERVLGKGGMATVNIGLGDFDKAIEWCERAAGERRGWVAYLGVHPVVDPLRGEPRFQTLVRKMGLEGIPHTH